MNKIKFSLTLALLVLLSGCGISKGSLGFGKQSPNEYSILKQQPLVVPPHFDLPEPKKKAGASTITEAEFDKIFYGNKPPSKVKKKKDLSNSDKLFLKKTSSHHKKKNIKKVIAAENKPETEAKKQKNSFLDKLLNR